VVAGNVEARAEVEEALAGLPHVVADNVVPRIGVLAPESARRAIREMFLSHVIGGKHLSSRADFTAMVRGATPDVVLTAVELLAYGLDAEHPGAGEVAVVDVGGATTVVHSVVEVDPEDSGLAREVVATVPVTRTVEGDLGMRWSAVTTLTEADAGGLVEGEDLTRLEQAAHRRQAEPGLLPDDEAEAGVDLDIASLAIAIALRRHAGRARVVFGPDGRLVERTGTDLREVDLLVGSGGVLRYGGPAARGALTGRLDDTGGWQLPREPRTVIDTDYVLAPAGLLAQEHPRAAYALLQTLVRR
jgi:uncharacterized protein (TIGR01319 family)